MAKVAALCCGLALAGCAASQPGPPGGPAEGDAAVTARAFEAGLPCSQATKIARMALLRMGYTIATVEPAKVGAPGKVVGHKTTGWAAATPEPGDDATAYIRITCSDQGAEFAAVTNEGFFGRMGFRQDFGSTVATLARQMPRRADTARAPQQGLIIIVEPLRSRESLAAFGVDLPTAGVTPVEVKLENRTARTYGFAAENVRLVTQEGSRVGALAASEANGKVGGSATAALDQRVIADGDVAPGATRSGFLYFPSSAYRRATITLIDRSTDETEGFSVEF